jgi:outer membrane lipoprotein SlyB
MRAFVIVPVLVLVLSGCTTSSKNTYNSADVGRMIETSEGKVLASRIVQIKDEPKGYGALAGGALGGTAAGVGIGKGGGSILAGVIGGLLGAGVGYLTEQQLRTHEGIEYMVRTSDGRTRTLVQNRENSEEPIPAGTPVLIQYAGSYTRIIEKSAGAGDDSWHDPDAGAASGGAAAAGGGTAGGAPAAGAAPAAPAGPPAGSWSSPPGNPSQPGTIRPRQQ